MNAPLSHLLKVSIPTLIVALALSTPAYAASITVAQTFSFGYGAGSLSNGTSTSSSSDFVGFSLFDSSLGNLTGVTVSIASAADLTTTASGAGLYASDSATGKVNLAATMGTGSVSSLGLGSGSLTVSCQGWGYCSSGQTRTINISNVIGPGAASFAGNPANMWYVSLLANVSVSNYNNGVLAGGAGKASGMWAGTISTTYNYTPVPEPGSMLLLGSGLLFVAARVRRRMRS